MVRFRASTTSPVSLTTASTSGLRRATSSTRSIPRAGSTVRTIDVAAHAGTAFDGRHLFQLSGDCIQKIDPKTGRVLSTIPAPGGAGSGLTWAEGALWMGQYRNRQIHQIDPDTGAVLRIIESDRFVTGVTWVDGELWHATSEGDKSDLRRVDPQTGEVLEQARYAAWNERLRTGIRRRRSILLRRREQRESQNRTAAQKTVPRTVRTIGAVCPHQGTFAGVRSACAAAPQAGAVCRT